MHEQIGKFCWRGDVWCEIAGWRTHGGVGGKEKGSKIKVQRSIATKNLCTIQHLPSRSACQLDTFWAG